MYTRHVNIPKNYNGVRFQQRQENDNIPVKEHRPSYNRGVKSSHSSLYNQKISAPVDEIEQIADEEPIYDEPGLDMTTENDTIIDAEPCHTYEDKGEKIKCCNLSNEPSSLSHLFSDLPIGNILSSINKEDLLLLGLILLMATEKNGANNDILTMLSLLLLKHK
jgi:hypothetical protein